MRDVQRSVDYLDFFLDATQHTSLCRHYVRELRRTVLISDDASAFNSGPDSQAHSILQHTEATNDENKLSALLQDEEVQARSLSFTPEGTSTSHTVTRQDLRSSAEMILYTFILPGSEREIVLPQTITQDVILDIEQHGRDDPQVFDAAKDYVFKAMENDAFPGFMKRRRALWSGIKYLNLSSLGSLRNGKCIIEESTEDEGEKKGLGII